MIESTLPSTNRKISAEEMDREAADWGAGDHQEVAAQATGARKISPTALSRTSQCLLRGLWAVQGVAGIGPSPFMQASFADGKAFEAALLEAETKKIWIRALNVALGSDLPQDLPIIKGQELKIKETESAADFSARVAKAFASTIEGQPAPFAIHEPTVACDESGTALRGKPDLLLWTGEKWILADFKCSEEARRSHGIQIAAYERMLGAMRPGEVIDPRGVVIHCAAGYRFTADSSDADRTTALAHTQATAFPITSLSPVVAEYIAFLADADGQSEPRALAEAVFSSVCNECEFRHRCYPRFLQARHVSLLPIMKSELEAVIEAGITSIDDLIAAIEAGKGEAYETLLELKESSPMQLRFLREKAQKVLASGLYSAWRASPASTASPLFFVSTGEEFLFEPALTDQSTPTCLVVYSEGERRRALAKMLELKSGWNIPAFVLSKEIQQTLHGPIPTLTLLPLAAILNVTKTYEGFQKLYPAEKANDPERFKKLMKESPEPPRRLKELKIIWDFLQSAAIPFTLTALDPAR